MFKISYSNLQKITEGLFKKLQNETTKIIDYLLLTLLALIWASAFFNIKIATYSFGPITIASRVFLVAYQFYYFVFTKILKSKHSQKIGIGLQL